MKFVVVIFGAFLIQHGSGEELAAAAAKDSAAAPSCACDPASDAQLATPICAIYLEIDPSNPIGTIHEKRVYHSECQHSCDAAHIIKVLPNEACQETSPWPWTHGIAAPGNAAGAIEGKMMGSDAIALARLSRETLPAVENLPDIDGWVPVATYADPLKAAAKISSPEAYNPAIYWKNPAHWWSHGIHAGVNGGLGVDLGIGRQGQAVAMNPYIPSFVLPLIQQRMAAKSAWHNGLPAHAAAPAESEH